MNGEEKEFNVENNVGVDSLNNMPQNNMDSISIDSLENSANFGMDMGIQANTMQSSSMTQMPNEEFNMTMNNADSMSTYQPDTSMPFVDNVVTPLDTSVVPDTQNAFVYTEDVSKDTQQSSLFTPQSQTSYTNNRTVNKQDDLKSNFKFMIIFAVIMLAIVILLPYIA